jgi:MATE family multidrug resistance protein
MNKKDSYSGSVKEIFPIALPIFFSQAIDVAMIFCDRYFLSKFGKEELAATLTGGITNYLVSTLLFGILGQLASLVGQYKGANQIEKAVGTVQQGLLLSILITPFLYLGGLLLIPELLIFFGHEQKLIENEIKYFSILSLTVITTSIRSVFANFFIGVGRTKIVSIAALFGVIINIPLTYILVFGKLGLPRLGIEGAAIGTVIASISSVLILVVKFYSKSFRQEFKTTTSFRIQVDLLYRLIRYGLPSGIESLVSVSGFLFFTMVMYSYSGVVAAATTIVLNWDMVCFIPLLGISQAVSGLVGKYLGEKRKDLALRSAYSALKLGWIYAVFITFLYFMFTSVLISPFTPIEMNDYDKVLDTGIILLKISCLYFLFDSSYQILGGVLKGSGDTLFPMIVSNTVMWSMASFTFYAKKNLQLTPIGSWYALTAMVFSLGLIYMIRFLQKKWLDRLMIKEANDE